MLANNQKAKLTAEEALIIAIATDENLPWNRVQNLNKDLLTSEYNRMIVSFFRDMWEIPMDKRPKSEEVSFQIEREIKRTGGQEEEENFKRYFSRMGRKIADVTQITEALNVFSTEPFKPISEVTVDKTVYEKTDIDILTGRDLFSLPKGAVKEIFNFMQESATRAVPEIALLDALQCVSSLIGSSATITGLKLNLITMGIAPSGAGKDNGQEIIKQALSHVGMFKIVSSSVTSQKAIAQTVIANDGRAFYISDEGHKFFDAVNKDSTAQYLRDASDDILSLYTSKIYAIRDQERRELEAKTEKLQNKLERLFAKQEQEQEDGKKVDLNKVSEIKSQIDKYNKIINHGIKNPQLNASFYSVPRKMDGVINIDSVESGLAGRSLIARASEERQRKRINRLIGERPPEFETISSIVQNIHDLSNEAPFEIQLDDDAKELANDIQEWFEARINDMQAGAIYARGMDNVMKVAGIASIPSKGKCFAYISIDCLEWAFKVVHQSISTMIDLLEISAPEEDQQATQDSLLYIRVRQISNGHLTALGTFKDKLSSKKWKDMLVTREVEKAQFENREPKSSFSEIVESYLNDLVANKLLISEEGKKGGFRYKSIAN